jgi:hypothetical protein
MLRFAVGIVDNVVVCDVTFRTNELLLWCENTSEVGTDQATKTLQH